MKQACCVLAFALAGLASAGSAAAQATLTHHAAYPAQPMSPATADPEQPRTAEQPDTTITIGTVGSDLEFLPSDIAVGQGKRLRIRYVNEGTFPHNIVVVKKESDIDPLGAAAFDASVTGYVPLNMTDRMVAYSPLAEPGKTIEFTFVVPPAGEYPFVCLYPGHYNMMVGTLRSLP